MPESFVDMTGHSGFSGMVITKTDLKKKTGGDDCRNIVIPFTKMISYF